MHSQWNAASLAMKIYWNGWGNSFIYFFNVDIHFYFKWGSVIRYKQSSTLIRIVTNKILIETTEMENSHYSVYI